MITIKYLKISVITKLFIPLGFNLCRYEQKTLSDRRTRTGIQDVLRFPATSDDQLQGCGYVHPVRIHQIYS